MAASSATIVYFGTKSRRTYTADVYVPDAVATSLTFSLGGLAGTGSSTQLRMPNEDCIIIDYSAVAAPTAVGVVFSQDGGQIPGSAIRHNNQLASLPNRPKLAIPVKAGSFLSGLQF